MSARDRARQWLKVNAEPGPIDPLEAMHDDAEAIATADNIIRALLAELDEKEAS